MPLGCALPAHFPTVVGMLSHGRGNLLNHGAEVLAPDENYDGCSRVAPREIPQNLIDGVGKCLGTVPYLAFTDEEIAVTLPNEDVRFPGHVERFASCTPLKLSIKDVRKTDRKSSSPR